MKNPRAKTIRQLSPLARAYVKHLITIQKQLDSLAKLIPLIDRAERDSVLFMRASSHVATSNTGDPMKDSILSRTNKDIFP